MATMPPSLSRSKTKQKHNLPCSECASNFEIVSRGGEVSSSGGQVVNVPLPTVPRFFELVCSLCKKNSEAQKLMITGIHPVQIYGHTAQGASNAQVHATCRSLKLGTVLGKTQACPISTVAWFFGVKRGPQTAARVEQISEWISMSRNCNVDTRRRIRKFWRKEAPMLASNPRRWNQATGPISAICSVLEAGWKPSSPGFWQSPDGSATLDGALFNKAQIIDSFSSDMEMQTWKAAARHSSSSGLEKGIITDGAINEPHLPADGSLPNQFLCVRCDWPPGSTNYENVLATL